MKFLVDECLSPRIARRLNERHIDALHPRDVGWRGKPDHELLRRAYREDRIIVTCDAADFRKLLGEVELHPGLVILPNLGVERTWRLVEKVTEYLSRQGDPDSYMVNRVLEIGEEGEISDYELPGS